MVAISRQPVWTIYPGGKVKTFNPWIRGFFQTGEIGIFEIGIPGDYSVGIMWTHRVGIWSRIKTRWITIRSLTLYVHLGRCDPYNPQTGKLWAANQ